MTHPVVVRRRPLVLLSALASLCASAACASGPTTHAATPTPTHLATVTGTGIPAPYDPAHPRRETISFPFGTPFSTMLRVETDLGLQPSLYCNGQTTGGSPHGWLQWRPVLPARPDAGYSSWMVELTPLTPPDWLQRLRVNPLVTSIAVNSYIFCPRIPNGEGTPPPGTLVYLSPGQDGTVARVHFRDPLTSYDPALEAAANLGLRLADPCHERAQPPSPWHPMGQEATFAASHTLVLATTLNASRSWQAQLHGTAGVSAIETPYTPAC